MYSSTRNLDLSGSGCGSGAELCAPPPPPGSPKLFRCTHHFFPLLSLRWPVFACCSTAGTSTIMHPRGSSPTQPSFFTPPFLFTTPLSSEVDRLLLACALCCSFTRAHLFIPFARLPLHYLPCIHFSLVPSCFLLFTCNYYPSMYSSSIANHISCIFHCIFLPKFHSQTLTNIIHAGRWGPEGDGGRGQVRGLFWSINEFFAIRLLNFFLYTSLALTECV